MKKELTDKAPTGCVGLPSESGWMTGEHFLTWLKHFVKYSKPNSSDNKVLLILDGHSSHKHLSALEYAKENNIVLFCLPPHCTHRVQPLDVTFFGPLTTYYNSEVTKWFRSHPGRTITHYQVGELFKEAHVKSATVSNAAKGFAATGIFPFNEDVFPEWIFIPSETTNNEINSNNSLEPVEFMESIPSNSEPISSKTASAEPIAINFVNTK
ncbi:hypothetical protein Zmor_024307 [Zophobas morio]|uniref:DDE-1 domain-containing protein n=1 Tax=Zophobas morio TaxID=2755281 RepID=A0AA38M8M6_9CUCU|nr:hypothetical protein Zmor_024307 [Zophobas morio]